MKEKLSTDRGSTTCRCCGSKNLTEVLNLGDHPLPSEYGVSAEHILEAFPLRLNICENCALGQIGEYVLPERIFHKTYPYLSSTSSTWVLHAQNFAINMTSKLKLNKNSLVVEVASNDGYLLSEFANLGIPVLGIEPAENVANIARSKGVSTISNFFGESVASEIVINNGHPNLIVANNVFAHVPNMIDFVNGLSTLANDETIITIENPSFSTLMNNGFFDTIYHEHYSYLSAHSVKEIASSVGLNLFHIDQLMTHGGSNRYWLSKTKKIDDSTFKVLQEETNSGLLDPNKWLLFREQVKKTIVDFRKWLSEKEKSGSNIIGYGAAHKGNTFLNAVGPISKKIKYVVDASPEKHGRFLPGSSIPVIPPSSLSEVKPTDVIILPWNIASEIAETVKDRVPNVRVWIAQPTMKEL